MKGSFVQQDFRGGEWSPMVQGRVSDERYRTGLNVCLNGVPREQGLWTRRPGFILGGLTRSGKVAVARTFHFTESTPYTVEFTAGHTRFWAGIGLATEAAVGITAMNTSNPAQITLNSAVTWATGDQIILSVGTNVQPVGAMPALNSVWAVTKIDTTHFTLSNPITGAGLDGSTVTGGNGLQAARIIDLANSYTATQLQGIRLVQGMSGNGTSPIALILQGQNAPQQLTAVGANGAGFQAFAASSPTFYDGPYLEPPSSADGSFLSPTKNSPLNWTFVASSTSWINGGTGFQSTDVGRLIRVFSEPPQWVSSTNYGVGQTVKYNGAYWQCQVAGAGNVPGAAIANASQVPWWPDPTAAAWTWGTIATVNSTTSVTVNLQAADPNLYYAGGDLLNGSQNVYTWQLGIYYTGNYPTGGCFLSGRFWVFGGIPNRFDGSYANSAIGALDFSPTDLYGNVNDAHACDEICEAEDANTIQWMVPIHTGILIGTADGEFHLTDAEGGLSITPTSIECHKTTKYKCANVEPVWTGMALGAVQLYARNVLEFISDVYSRRITAVNLQEYATHLTTKGIAEIAYQYALNPTIWTRTNDGQLLGCHYRRHSPFGTNPPDYYGWSRHTLGSGRTITSLRSGPSPDGTLDNLSIVTFDPVTSLYYMEFSSKDWEESDTLLTAYYVDGGSLVSSAQYIAGSPDVIRLYGLGLIAGRTIDVWAGGIDMGSFTVSATGTVDLPVGVGASLFTTSYLASLPLTGVTYGILGTYVQPATGYSTTFGAATAITGSNPAPGFLVDWKNYIGYALGAGNGVMSYNLKTLANLENYTSTTATYPACIDVNGFIYWSQSSSNQGPLYKSSTNAQGQLSLVATFGRSGGVINTDATHMASPFQMTTVQQGGYNYLLNSWLVGNNIDLFSTDSMSWYQTVAYTGGATRMYLSRGVGNTAYGAVAVGASGVTFYKLQVVSNWLGGASLQVTPIGTLAPASIEGDWTSVDDMAGVCYDETDGNLIIGVKTTHGSPTHTNYLLKVSATSGSLMWAIPDIGLWGDQHSLQQSRARAGRLNITTGATGYTINTTGGSVIASTGISHSGGLNVTDGASGTTITRDGGNNTWYIWYGSNGAGSFPNGDYFVPFAVGFSYTSEGQILRAVVPDESRSPSGPTLGQKRRTHQFGCLFYNTGNAVSVGTIFTDVKPVNFRQADDITPVPLTSMFSGVHWDTLQDDNSFDSMFCWVVSRPYPCNVCAVEPMLESHPT